MVGGFDQPNPVTADGRHAGSFQAGDAAPDDEHVALSRCSRVPVGIFRLAAAAGLAHAGHDRVARVAHLTGLVAADAGADALVLVGGQLRHQVRVGDLGARHLHGIADTVADRPLGLTPLDH
jgi:hypothetical protein